MGHIGRPVRRGVGVVLVVGLAFAPAIWAQTENPKSAVAPAEIEELVVTARKREENIQEIPVSVTAFSGAVLSEKGVRTIVDLGQAVPNLYEASNTATLIGMRGTAQNDLELVFQPPVGLYVDGAYLAKIVGLNLDLEDLERVEVLRGPQGTLYGRNTIGGAVNFITKKPTEERSITLTAEAGNYNAFNSRLTANVPLAGKNGAFQSETLGTISLRETVGYKSHDGYFQNALPGGAPALPAPSGGNDYSNLNRFYNMTGLRWQPTKDITVDYWLEYHRYRNSAMPYQLTYADPAVFGSALDPYIQRNRSGVTPSNAPLTSDFTAHPLSDTGRHIMHILTGTWDLGEVGPLGKVTVKSISSYRSFLDDMDLDLDGTPTHILDFILVGDVQHWSEDLQWVGTAPRLQYVLGAYYYGEYAMQNQDTIAFAAGNFSYKHLTKTKSYSPYGQLTWTPPVLRDKLSLTAGIRYTQEQVHEDNFWEGASPFTISQGKAFGGTDGLSPMGDLSYQWTDDLLTYSRVSRGFRGGGFTSGAPAPELAALFKPEKLLAYELGFKSQWFGKRLRLNADGFFSDYRDLQESVFRISPTLGTFAVVGNAEKAEIWGMEFEGTAVPVRGLEVTVGYSFIAPKYLTWTDQKFDQNGNPVFDSQGNPVTENVANHRAFADAPHHQGSVGVTYTAPPTTTGTFSAHVDVYWQDKTVYVPNNETPASQADEGWAYAVANGRLAYTGIPLRKGSLDLAVFGRNLFDRKYRTWGLDLGGFGMSTNLYGDPRTFGLQLTYNFTAS